MLAAARKIGLAALAFIFPLYLWREIYPLTDWAILALLPLGIMLFLGTQMSAAALYRARLQVALRTTSPLSGLLAGKLRSMLVAFGFTAVAMPVLSWQALSSKPAEMMGIGALCLLAGALSLMSQAWLIRHLHIPFTRSTGMTIGTVVIAVVFVPILAWINWNYVSHPGEMVGLVEAMQIGINELPVRRGWIAELLAGFYGAEAAKWWFVLKFKSSYWVMVLFSLDSALVAFIVAKAFVVLTEFVNFTTNEAK